MKKKKKLIMRCVALIVVLGIILMGCSKKTPEQSQGTQSTQEEVQTQTQTQTSEEEPANNDPVDPAPAEPDPADTVKYGENLLVNAGFENGSEGWVATGGTLEIITDEALASEGSSFAYISGRTSNWNCVAQNITDILSQRESGTSYYISFDVKLSDDYTTNGVTSQQVQFKTTSQSATEASARYDVDMQSGCSAMANADTWTKVEGTIQPVWAGDLMTYEFKMAEQPNTTLADGTYGSYYVDNAQLKEILPSGTEVAMEELPRMYEAFTNTSTSPLAKEGFGYGGSAGVCIGPDALLNARRMELVKYHFNTLTIENQLKQDALLGQNWSDSGVDDPNSDKNYPALHFDQAKTILAYIKFYNETAEEPIKIRGHVLVWHSQAKGWFFRKDYDPNGEYVSTDVMNARLEYYIKTVFEYLEQEGYADLFYAYDVVNEAVSDDGTGYRKNGDWWGLYQSNEFIINAFKYANKYAPSHIKLFYNDYNDTVRIKALDIVELLKAVEAEEGEPGVGTRLDGMGMQGHYNMGDPSAEEFKFAARAFTAAMDPEDEIHITELDMKATPGFTVADEKDPEKFAVELQKQGEHYLEIYNAVRELNGAGETKITNITFWGTHDAISWLKGYSGVGGGGNGDPVFPLPFDDIYQPKPAFWAFVNPDKVSE